MGPSTVLCMMALVLATPALANLTLLTPPVLEPADACEDFEGDRLRWTHADCIEVWSAFSRTVPPGLRRRLPDVDLWRQTASELRRLGSPCLIAPTSPSDGVGSSTIRHLASWIFAEQMGCDWVRPDWGKRRVDAGNGTSTVLYCHRTATTQEVETGRPSGAMNRCSVVDWLSYFQLDLPSVSLPEERSLKVVELDLRSTEALFNLRQTFQSMSFLDQPWEQVAFTFHPTLASQHLVNLMSWDETKRRITRNVLETARNNFHRHPRPWYDQDPHECRYYKGRLHFAVHVRLGDRREFQDANVEYFEMLELVMHKISEEVVGHMGLTPPLYHVFSETTAHCPSEETGLFEEFPPWPVVLDQVPACLAATTPDDCPEKRAGAFCPPNRSGVFDVVGKPIVLHVGPDVRSAMSCMIQATGVIMGCSTFGHIAGLLTRGISFFSVECGGSHTPDQYKFIPPLAVSERGHLWVPIAGSWRDPVLTSTGVLRGSLETLIHNPRHE